MLSRFLGAVVATVLVLALPGLLLRLSRRESA